MSKTFQHHLATCFPCNIMPKVIERTHWLIACPGVYATLFKLVFMWRSCLDTMRKNCICCHFFQRNDVEDEVVTPLNTLLLMFQGPGKIIKKRHDKLLDYESINSRTKGITEGPQLRAVSSTVLYLVGLLIRISLNIPKYASWHIWG